MRKTYVVLIVLVLILIGELTLLYFYQNKQGDSKPINFRLTSETAPTSKPSKPLVSVNQPGDFAEIPQQLHAFQTFNNCGPATLSMMLSYYQINQSQQELGQKLRPYQNPQGDNDDKSVTFEEMAQEAENNNLKSYIRPNGTIETLKMFTANGIPVGVRTLLTSDDDIGHFRVVVGFDDTTGEIIQDDSYQGPRLRYSYETFLSLWQPFNYQYMVFATQDNIDQVEAALGIELDEKVAWENAYERAQEGASTAPNNIYPKFNQAVSLYYLGRYSESIVIFEQIEATLSFRTLWYQIEPIQAYQKLSNRQRVFDLTDRILNNNNLAFSQLYIIRGDSLLAQQDLEGARLEYEKAVFYNQNLELAKEKLDSINSN